MRGICGIRKESDNNEKIHDYFFGSCYHYMLYCLRVKAIHYARSGKSGDPGVFRDFRDFREFFGFMEC